MKLYFILAIIGILEITWISAIKEENDNKRKTPDFDRMKGSDFSKKRLKNYEWDVQEEADFIENPNRKLFDESSYSMNIKYDNKSKVGTCSFKVKGLVTPIEQKFSGKKHGKGFAEEKAIYYCHLIQDEYLSNPQYFVKNINNVLKSNNIATTPNKAMSIIHFRFNMNKSYFVKPKQI
jgi:hypothetical protein